MVEMYDKGVRTLKRHLPRQNQVVTYVMTATFPLLKKATCQILLLLML